MVEHDIWKREKNLKNIKEVVVEFERKMSIKVRKQEKLDMVVLEKENYQEII